MLSLLGIKFGDGFRSGQKKKQDGVYMTIMDDRKAMCFLRSVVAVGQQTTRYVLRSVLKRMTKLRGDIGWSQ